MTAGQQVGRERDRDSDRRVARELAHYFEYSQSGVEVLADGLQEMRFGEFLVAARAISRQQLLTALMFQDRNPGVRLGECIAALGFLSSPEIENPARPVARPQRRRGLRRCFDRAALIAACVRVSRRIRLFAPAGRSRGARGPQCPRAEAAQRPDLH